MATTSDRHGKPPAAKVVTARQETDARLQGERARADTALQQKLPETQQRADAKVEAKRDHIEEKIDHVADAGAPAAAELARRAVEEERAAVDEAHAHERGEQRKIFHDVLRGERAQTDRALEGERQVADLLVHNRDELLGVVSHDIRNLVNAILLRIALLKELVDEREPGERARKLADDVHRAARVIQAWTGDLVDLSTLEAGALKLRKKACDLGELVEETGSFYRSLASSRSVVLQVDVDRGTSLAIQADPERIVQVLSNLVDNAVKFTPANGQVRVSVRGEGEHVCACVEDAGPGIAEEERQHIFDRYWRGRGGEGAGAGLGLFICRRIVELHGGEITVESELGRGSTFRVKLPRALPE